MQFQDKHSQPLKYLVLQGLVLLCIVALFFFTLNIGNHSMLENRAETRKEAKAELIAKIDHLPHIRQAQQSFDRLKKSWDTQRKYADSQLKYMEEMNQQGSRYITNPRHYMAIKARADSSETAAVTKLEQLRQFEIDQITQDQAQVQASVIGSFVDQHPSIILSFLAFFFAAVFSFEKRINQKLIYAGMSLICEILAALIFGLDFYASFLPPGPLVRIAACATGGGICVAYGAAWDAFRQLGKSHAKSLSVSPTPEIERNLPIVEPQKELSAPKTELSQIMGQADDQLTLTDAMVRVKMGRWQQKDICRKFGMKAYEVSRLLHKAEKKAQSIKAETGTNGLSGFRQAVGEILQPAASECVSN